MKFARTAPRKMTSLIALSFLATAGVASTAIPSDPPWLPDQHYVANGCYISAMTYIANLLQRYPNVEARTANVVLPSGKLHTVAIVRWENRLYLRDMYIAVAEIRNDLQQSFETALRAWHEKGGRDYYPERRPRSTEERRKEVELAARLLRFAKPQMTYVRSSTGPVKVLWWTTSEGDLAVYEPSVGTAVGPSGVSVADVFTHVIAPFNETNRENQSRYKP